MKTFDHSTRRRAGFHRGMPLVIAVGLLLAAACSDDDGEPRANTESVDSSDTASESDASSSDGESADESDDDATEGGSGSDSSSGEVLGTTQAQLPANAIDNRSTPMRVDVTRLERHGELVELTMVLTNEAPTDDGEPQDFMANTMFGGGVGIDGRYDISSIGLVDGDAQKLYLPVFDSDDHCLCTDGMGATEVPPGGTLTLEATYGGVPDDVEQLDVSIPSFPAIVGVPIR